jgi:hypothetical protein
MNFPGSIRVKNRAVLCAEFVLYMFLFAESSRRKKGTGSVSLLREMVPVPVFPWRGVGAPKNLFPSTKALAFLAPAGVSGTGISSQEKGEKQPAPLAWPD